MKIIKVFGAIMLILAVSGCTYVRPVVTDQREAFLSSAASSDPDFPDGISTKLTHFSHIGTVLTTSGPLNVTFLKQVILGMPSPRGASYLHFFDSDYRWVGKQTCQTYPLWCEGGNIFMFGLDDWGGQSGNVWNLSDGFAHRTLVLKPAYGSYELHADRNQ